MATRQNTLLIKRSNIIGKIPPISGLTIGELALNTADAKLYTIFTSGTTGATEVREIGWDRIHRTGDTITGDFNFFGDIKISGSSQPNGYALAVTGDTTLSGLTIVYGPTPTSAAIQPGVNNSYDLGNPSFRWREIFTTNIDVSNLASIEYLNVDAFSNFYNTANFYNGGVNITGDTTQYGNVYISGTSLSGQCAFEVDGNVCIDGDVLISGDTSLNGDVCISDANSGGAPTGTACLGTNLIPTSGTTYHEFQNKNGTLAHLGDLATGEPNSKGYVYMTNNTTPTPLLATPTYLKISGTTFTIPQYLNLFTTGSTNNELLYNYPSASGSTVTYLKYNISYTCTASANGRRVTFALRRTPNGGSPQNIPSEMSVYVAGANNDITGTLTGIVTAQYLDSFEVVAANTSGSGPGYNLIVSDFTFSLFT